MLLSKIALKNKIIFAVQKNNSELIRKATKLGASIDTINNSNDRIIVMAAKLGHFKAATALWNLGVRTYDSDGMTLADVAFIHRNSNYKEFERLKGNHRKHKWNHPENKIA